MFIREALIICTIVLSTFFKSDVSAAKCVCCEKINDYCCKTPNGKDACCQTEGQIDEAEWPSDQCKKDPGSENKIQCDDNGQRINSRIGGPNSCIVKPHSEPWMAKLIFSDKGSIFAESHVLSEASKNETLAAQIMKNYEELIPKWMTYFPQDAREKAEKLLFKAKDALGDTKSVHKIIDDLPETDSFADNTVHTVEAHRCGGSLITRRHVLTAAHCVCFWSETVCIFSQIIYKNCTETTECILWKSLGVVLGDHDSTIDDGEKVFQIKNTIVNKKYAATKNLQGLKYDFAIIALQDQVSLNERIQLIQLPSEDITCPLGKQFIISGWGIDRFQNKDIPITDILSTRFLQAVYMDCLDIKECPEYGNDDPSLVFVGDSLKRQNSACYGDSGGPLTLRENGITKLYGVTSFGTYLNESERCLNSNTVYGRVSEPATLKWIKSNTKSFF